MMVACTDGCPTGATNSLSGQAQLVPILPEGVAVARREECTLQDRESHHVLLVSPHPPTLTPNTECPGVAGTRKVGTPERSRTACSQPSNLMARSSPNRTKSWFDSSKLLVHSTDQSTTALWYLYDSSVSRVALWWCVEQLSQSVRCLGPGASGSAVHLALRMRRKGTWLNSKRFCKWWTARWVRLTVPSCWTSSRSLT